MRKSRKNPEQDFQIALVRDLRRILGGEVVMTHFPAGGGGAIRGARLKAMGMMRGFPDLMFLTGGHCFCLELKATKRNRSEAQIECHGLLEKAGIPVRTIKTLDEALRALRDWKIPIRIIGDWTQRNNLAGGKS